MNVVCRTKRAVSDVGRTRMISRSAFFATMFLWSAMYVSFAIAQPPAQSSAKPAVDYVAPAPTDAAAELNLSFRAAYAHARADVLAGAKPVIWFDGEKLVLIARGTRTSGTLVPVKYNRLKAIAHLPFTLFLELRDPKSRPAEEAAATWKRLTGLLAGVERELPTYEFTTDELARQRKIVDESKRVIEAAVAGRYPTHDELIAFTRRMGPLQEANALAAAAIELGHYRQQFDAWSKERGPSFAEEVTILISGSQMPRKRNRVTQLFAAILGVPGEGKRIIYAEGLYDGEKALNLFGTHNLDAESAGAFFDDTARLDEDLLSRGAAKYVAEQFPKPPGAR